MFTMHTMYASAMCAAVYVSCLIHPVPNQLDFYAYYKSHVPQAVLPSFFKITPSVTQWPTKAEREVKQQNPKLNRKRYSSLF